MAADDVLPDADSPFGQRVRDRLRTARVIWLTTVGAEGTPQPNPVWFLWDEPATLLVYNRPDAHRLAHIAARPKVALHFDGNGDGGDIVVFAGAAQTVDRPLAHENPDYVAKYGPAMGRVSGTIEQMARDYPVALEITISRVRGF